MRNPTVPVLLAATVLVLGLTIDADSHRVFVDKRTMAFLPPTTSHTGSISTYDPDDGDYRLEIKIDGEPYGTRPFQGKDGKFAYTGRTVRGADPLTFAEGGQDAFWFTK
jgi:hypothetical protein